MVIHSHFSSVQIHRHMSLEVIYKYFSSTVIHWHLSLDIGIRQIASSAYYDRCWVHASITWVVSPGSGCLPLGSAYFPLSWTFFRGLRLFFSLTISFKLKERQNSSSSSFFSRKCNTSSFIIILLCLLHSLFSLLALVLRSSRLAVVSAGACFCCSPGEFVIFTVPFPSWESASWDLGHPGNFKCAP